MIKPFRYVMLLRAFANVSIQSYHHHPHRRPCSPCIIFSQYHQHHHHYLYITIYICTYLLLTMRTRNQQEEDFIQIHRTFPIWTILFAIPSIYSDLRHFISNIILFPFPFYFPFLSGPSRSFSTFIQSTFTIFPFPFLLSPLI